MRRCEGGASARAGGRALVALALAGTLASTLTACTGDSGRPEGAPARPPVSATPTPTPTDSGAPAGDAGDPGGDANDLAKAAEKLAREKGGPTSDIAPRDGEVLGGDVSWPQCPPGTGIPQKQGKGLPMPLPDAEFVIIGLTNGPGFTRNPCIADQVAWAKRNDVLVSVYAVSSYPDAATLDRYGADGPFDPSTKEGRLGNVGYSQARATVRTMGDVGLVSPIVWMDIEPVPLFEWSSDTAANAAVVRGVARGYVDAGFAIGVYSTPALYRRVVGDLELGALPEWRAAGQTSREEARSRCGPDWTIQGGPGVLGQWVEDQRDRNLTCPGTSADLARYFHRYS